MNPLIDLRDLIYLNGPFASTRAWVAVLNLFTVVFENKIPFPTKKDALNKTPIKVNDGGAAISFKSV